MKKYLPLSIISLLFCILTVFGIIRPFSSIQPYKVINEKGEVDAKGLDLTIKDIYTKLSIVSENNTQIWVYAGTAQNIASVSWTKVQLNTENFDTLGEFDSTTNYRFTVKVEGRYFISTTVVYDNDLNNVVADKIYRIAIYKNGTSISSFITHSSHAGHLGVAVSDLVKLVKNDYIEIYTYHNAGVTQTIGVGTVNSWLSIQRITN